MRPDPAELESQFLRLQRVLNGQVSPGQRLLALLSFHELLQSAPADIDKTSWEASLGPRLMTQLVQPQLNELPLPVLERLLAFALSLPEGECQADKVAELRESLAKKWVWVGENERALDVLEHLRPVQRRQWLEALLRERDRSFAGHDPSAVTLLVVDGECGEDGGWLARLRIRPAMRTSSTKLVLRPQPAEYDPSHLSLREAVSASLRLAGPPRQHRLWTLTVHDPEVPIGGASLGAASAALLSNALLRLEARSRYGFLRSAGITGEISSEGQVRRVDESALSAKVRRAFFSPLETLFVPVDQEGYARSRAEELNHSYPARQLDVVGIDTLSELLQDRRFARRIYALPTAPALRRATLSPMFNVFLAGIGLVILYFIMALALPGLRFWRDNNPATAETSRNYPLLRVHNQAGEWLWTADAETGKRDWLFPDGRSVAGIDLNLPTGYEWCAIGDCTGDELNDVVAVSHWESTFDTLRVTLLSHKGKILRQRSLCPQYFPASNPLAEIRMGAYRTSIVDWNGNGYGHPVVSLVSQHSDKRCALVEFDPETLNEVSVSIKKEWWFLVQSFSPPVRFSSVEDNNLRATVTPSELIAPKDNLWLGGRVDDHGSALLAILHDGIPDGPFPPADTTGMQIFRFPIDPLCRYRRSPMEVVGFSHSHNEGCSIRIDSGDIKPNMSFGYRFTTDGNYIRTDYFDSNWAHRHAYFQDHDLPDSIMMTRASFDAYMDCVQRWTGTSWEPVDPKKILPDSCYSLLSPL